MAVVRYLVRDVDEAIRFYQALGFEVTQKMGPPFAMVARGDLTLWLSGPASSAARPMSDGSMPAPGGWNRLVIEVTDLEAAMAAVRPTGARFRSDPVVGPGGTQIVVDDPSGNPIELFQAAG
jgi:catechol 2,3-dioxygenase-like lactoylglutathione lyase family enzyme